MNDIIKHLSTHGKNKTWTELAKEYGFVSDDAARNYAKRHFKKLKAKSIEKSVSTSFTEQNGELWIKNVWYPYPPEPEEVMKDHNADPKKYRLNQFWSKADANRGGVIVSASFLHLNFKENFTEMFLNFLEKYNPNIKNSKPPIKSKQNNSASIIINKQDAHINKLCIKGSNNIQERLEETSIRVIDTLEKASTINNLDTIYYVLGSDLFNSEWNNATTRGTAQENIMSYEDSFRVIADYEINIINTMLLYADRVEVIYVPGNHDKYVGWHLLHLLKSCFRSNNRVDINDEMSYTKCISVYDTAIVLNHGYDIKPEQLCNNFPIEFKDQFCKANYYYVFTGDKHVEEVKTYGAIRFYRIPALSKYSGDWDNLKGYTTGIVELNSFIIEPNEGLTLIIKKQ
jgi:UDP-2,3-diacylglucosamine pyrophosphatase LpxH